jgi:peptidoglycan/xylan/chitin deacetylase (PgdA/CDA1 family)
VRALPAVRRIRDALLPIARDTVAGALAWSGRSHPLRAARGLLTVVTFHRVLTQAALREYPIVPIAVSDVEFAWLVDHFRRNYTCGTLAEIHRRWATGEEPGLPFLAITFDDGQRDNHDHAAPVLDGAGMKASFFVPVDGVDGNTALWHDQFGFAARWLLANDRPRAIRLLDEVGISDGVDDDSLVLAALEGSKRLPPAARLGLAERLAAAAGSPRPEWDGMMSWDHLRDLARRGHEVGSHSMTHAILTQVDASQLEHEVRGSRNRIESELGVPCESFCYPNGDCDERVAEAVRKAGYRRAVTTAWGTNSPGADPFRLRRCDAPSARIRDRHGRLSEARLAFRMSHLFPGPRQ